MTTFHGCDWCGQLIAEDEAKVALIRSVGGLSSAFSDAALDGPPTRHYHATRQRDCYGEFNAVMRLAHENHAAMREGAR